MLYGCNGSFTFWNWTIYISTSEMCVLMCRPPSGTHQPPDGAPTLQNDPSKAGGSHGIHLQPLALIFVHGTPGPIVNVSILDTRLKTRHAIRHTHISTLNKLAVHFTDWGYIGRPQWASTYESIKICSLQTVPIKVYNSLRSKNRHSNVRISSSKSKR